MQYNPTIMENASKILIVPALPYFDFDKILAVTVLARALHRKYNAQVDILSPKQDWWQAGSKVLGLEDVDIITKLDANSSQLRLTNLGSAIHSVEWMQEADGIVLSITPESNIKIDLTQLRLEPVGIAYQQIYTIDVRSREELQQLLQINPDVLQNARITALNTTEPETGISAESFLYRDSNIYADVVARYASLHEFELTPEEATALLSGIYWKTNSLQNFYTTAAVFETTKNLLRQRARLSLVVNNVFATATASQQKLWQEALHNLEVLPESKVGFSEVDRETAFNFNKDLKINPLYNPLVFAGGLDASFVFLPLSDKYTEILCSTFSKEINLRKIFQDYKLKGDTLQGIAAVHMNINDARELVRRLLGLDRGSLLAVPADPIPVNTGVESTKSIAPEAEIPNTVNDLVVPTDVLTAILAEAAAAKEKHDAEIASAKKEAPVKAEPTSETVERSGFVEIHPTDEEAASQLSTDENYAPGYGSAA